MLQQRSVIGASIIAAVCGLTVALSTAGDRDELAGEEPRFPPPAGQSHRGPLVDPSFVDTEVSDVVFIIDGSGSINAAEFAFQKSAVTESVQYFPADGSTAVAVIQFSGYATVEVPLTLLDSPATVQTVIDAIDAMTQQNGSTHLLPPLNEAYEIYDQHAGGVAPTLFILTDGGVADIPLAEARCGDLRTMSPPVTICTALVGHPCPMEDQFLMNCANTPESQTFNPDQPIGSYRCVDVLAQFGLLCEECLCVTMHAGGPDCDNDGIPDACELDCDGNGIPDDCDEPQSLCLANELARIAAADGEAGDRFGGSVSAWADELLVGAMAEDEAANNAGAAYIFRHEATGWVQGPKLTASDAGAGHFFGASVSLSRDRALVGAFGHDGSGPHSGAAYIFARDAGGADNWGQRAILVASDASFVAEFGASVSLSGNVALVGAYGDMHAGVLSGAAYIFERHEGGANNWGQLVKLVASDPHEAAEFGRSVCVSGDLAVVGAPGSLVLGDDPGTVYIFRRSAGGLRNWGQIARLSDPNAPPGNHFGASVAIHGDLLVIGATNVDGCGTRAYLYRYDGADWLFQRTFAASDNALADHFGSAASINGSVAVIGAEGDEHQGPATGAAYVYLFDGTTGDEQAKLTASDAAPDDEFATSVSVRCNTAVFGAPGDDDAGIDAGAAYVVRGVSDCNENGVVDICDIESGYSADVNANGIPDECEDACWNGQVRIAQESAPGVGDFEDNILGCLAPFSTITTAGDFYTYTAELHSYDGSCLQLVKSHRSYLLMADTADGMSLVIVHDRAFPNDPDGGHAEMSLEVFGDNDGAVRIVSDDPQNVDQYTGDPGDTLFTSDNIWDECCTDGQILSDLDDEWSLLVQFTEVDGDPTSPPFEGLTTWYAYSADCGQIELALEPDRRVRLEYIAAASAPADLNGDGVVDVLDLLLVLGAWGNCSGCPEDINGDGVVDVLDMLEVLAAWGPCG